MLLEPACWTLCLSTSGLKHFGSLKHNVSFGLKHCVSLPAGQMRRSEPLSMVQVFDIKVVKLGCSAAPDASTQGFGPGTTLALGIPQNNGDTRQEGGDPHVV